MPARGGTEPTSPPDGRGCRPTPRARRARGPCSRGGRNRARSPGSRPTRESGPRGRRPSRVTPRVRPAAGHERKGKPRAQWRPGPRTRKSEAPRGWATASPQLPAPRRSARSECRESRRGRSSNKNRALPRRSRSPAGRKRGPTLSLSFRKGETARHGGTTRVRRPRPGVAPWGRSTTLPGAPLAPWPRSGAPDLEATVVDEQLAAAGGQQGDFVCSGDVRLQPVLPILPVDDDVAIGWKLRRQDLNQRAIGQPHRRAVI